MTTGFKAYDNAIDITKAIKPIVNNLLKHDPKLADQMRRATQSIGLNVSEAAMRSGKDRRHSFRIALGSASEVRAALDQAEAWDYVPPTQTKIARELLDHEVAMLWKLGKS